MIRVEIADRQKSRPVDKARLRAAVKETLQGEGIRDATISLAIVDDAEMHELNRRHLRHDYPTDVLSFAFEATEDSVDGEVIVSVDTAARLAAELGHDAADELLLYVIHGTLHLVGYDDHEDEDRAAMRAREKHYLARFSATVGDERK